MKYLFLLVLVSCSSQVKLDPIDGRDLDSEITPKCQEKLDKKDKALMHCALDLDNCKDDYKAPTDLKQRTYSW